MTDPKQATARGIRAVTFAIATITAGTTADAAHYDISGDIEFEVPGTVVLDSYSVSGPVSNSRQVRYDNVVPNRSWHGRAGSGVDAYGVHASTYVGANNVADGGSGGLSFAASANALVSFTDFVITGPSGSLPVHTPINFHLSGEQILGPYASGSPIYTSDVQSSVALQIFAGSNATAGTRNFSYRNGLISPPTQSGLLADYDGTSADLRTPVWTLPVNTPFTLTLILNTSASVGVIFADGYITSALSDFGSTLSFATDRPVFALPAGYTVNSVDAGVVDNAWMSPVPEPGSALLAALGLAFIGARSLARSAAVMRWTTAPTPLPRMSPTSRHRIARPYRRSCAG